MLHARYPDLMVFGSFTVLSSSQGWAGPTGSPLQGKRWSRAQCLCPPHCSRGGAWPVFPVDGPGCVMCRCACSEWGAVLRGSVTFSWPVREGCLCTWFCLASCRGCLWQFMCSSSSSARVPVASCWGCCASHVGQSVGFPHGPLQSELSLSTLSYEPS